MLKVSAAKYIALGEHIHDLRALFFIRSADEGFDDRDRAAIKEGLERLLALCRELNLTVSGELIARKLRDMPQSDREWDLLVDALRAELRTKLFVFVPPHRASFYESDSLLTIAATQAFPTAVNEIKAAGNCYSVGLYTASVFHSMRAVEIGLRALGNALSVSFPFPIEQAEWHPLIEQIQSRIEEQKKRAKSAEKDTDLQFYSEAAVQFRYFKDGWRIRVAHARATYDEPEALGVVEHARSFFETLATRLSE